MFLHGFSWVPTSRCCSYFHLWWIINSKNQIYPPFWSWCSRNQSRTMVVDQSQSSSAEWSSGLRFIWSGWWFDKLQIYNGNKMKTLNSIWDLENRRVEYCVCARNMRQGSSICSGPPDFNMFFSSVGLYFSHFKSPESKSSNSLAFENDHRKLFRIKNLWKGKCTLYNWPHNLYIPYDLGVIHTEYVAVLSLPLKQLQSQFCITRQFYSVKFYSVMFFNWENIYSQWNDTILVLTYSNFSAQILWS